MALTITIVAADQHGRERTVLADVKGDASYGTGGYAVTPAAFGLTQLRGIEDLNSAQTAGAAGKLFEYDATNAKLKILVSAAAGSALQEVAGASDQSGATRRLRAYGF